MFCQGYTNPCSDYCKHRLGREKWKKFRDDVESLASCLAHYCDYLGDQCKKMKLNHASSTPVRSFADSICVKFVKPLQGTGAFIILWS